MISHRENLLAIAAMSVAMLGFVCNDTQVKLASEALPLGEVIFLRGVLTVIIMAVMTVAMGQHRQWHLVRSHGVFWRTVGEVGGTVLFLTALVHLPIAEATTIMQAIPLVVTAAGALFLGEVVGWRRWTAIIVGFIGVLIVVRPGFTGFDGYSVMVVVAVLFAALRDIATRTIPRKVPTVLVAAVATVAVTITGVAMGLGETWRWPDPAVWVWLLGSACCLLVGYWFIIVAMRTGETAVSSPFRYTVIIWATMLGFFVWGDRPDFTTVLGTALIIGTGVYTFYRERKLALRDLAR